MKKNQTTDNNYEQLFIVGCPRSGTTFLSKLLESTKYGKPYETHFIPKVLKKYIQRNNLSQKHFFKIATSILRERSIKQFVGSLDINELYNACSSNLSLYNLINVISLAGSSSNTHAWGDKTPWYATQLQLIADFFPSAKFIYITRDPRAVCASLMKKKWAPKNVFSCAQLWNEHNEFPPDLLNKLKEQNRLFSIRYEDIVKNPSLHTSHVLSFLGEPHELLDEIKIDKYTNSNTNEKWKQELKQKDIETIEILCQEKMKELGYVPITQTDKVIPSCQKLMYLVDHKVRFFFHLVELNTIDALKIKFNLKKPFDE